MKRLIAILFAAFSIVSAASVEFPICTAPGEQFYPDVCWDGQAFWVVWQDDSQGTIRGIRVNEEGQLVGSEVELLNKDLDPGPVRYPCVAAGLDRIAVEARVMAGYDEFDHELWGVMHKEYTFEGQPLYSEPARLLESFDLWGGTTPVVLFGNEHFFSFIKIAHATEVDVHSEDIAVALDSGGFKQMMVWESSEIHFEDLPPVACWDGERFLVIFFDEMDDLKHKGAFIEDTFAWQGIGGQFDIGREMFPPIPLPSGTPKYQSLVPGSSRFFLVSQADVGLYGFTMGFNILDSAGTPINDSATFVESSPEIKRFYPDAIFNGKYFLIVWGDVYNSGGIDLYTIKVDTFGNIVDSGVVVYGSDAAIHPALASGRTKCLLVWSDNRNGEFDIYGMLLDAEGIQEKPIQDTPYAIQVFPTIFTDRVTFHLSTKGGEERTLTIYDAVGRRVNTLKINPGVESILWDGRNLGGNQLPAGVYFVSLSGKEFSSIPSTRIVKTR